MTKQMKREWLAALRSGKYRQTKGQLHDGRGFCCIGVLLDACVPGEWETVGRDGLISPSDAPKGPHWKYVMPNGRDVAPDAGEADLPNGLLNGSDAWELMQMNDDGVGFYAIADWIEANVEAA